MGFERIVIYVKAGRYVEQVRVEKPNVTLYGAGRDRTLLTFAAASGSRDPSGELYGRYRSATLSISAPDFNLRRMTVENSFDYKKERRKTPTDPSKILQTQARAILTIESSDRATFRSCVIKSYQDTLQLESGRTYVENCIISGNTDFIFGSGRAAIEHSEIISRYDGLSPNKKDVIVAPSTSSINEFGFVFINTILRREPGIGDGVIYLGRPWRRNGMAVFIDSWMGRHIHADGWTSMRDTDDNGIPIINLPQNARFYERNSRGPGGVINSNRRQLKPSQLKKVTKERLFSDWSTSYQAEPVAVHPDRVHKIFGEPLISAKAEGWTLDPSMWREIGSGVKGGNRKCRSLPCETEPGLQPSVNHR